MPKRSNDDEEDEENSIPLPIQTFLWRQTSPFIRPKFGKLQDATAMEQREACKSFEKVLVQNIQFGLSPSLTEAIKSISRWRVTQAALPHVMHCCAALLYNRKNSNLDKLGAAETKLLYTLHWILLDAADECLEYDAAKTRDLHPDHHLLPIPTIEVFIYLFAPLISYLKQTDFLVSFRLENGYKIWDSLFQYRHPDIPSFVAKVKPKRHIIRASRFDKKDQSKFEDVYVGAKGPTPKPEEEVNSRPEQHEAISDVGAVARTSSSRGTKGGSLKSPKSGACDATLEDREKAKRGAILSDPSMATYLDVAVIRCLFTSQWLEEGVNWALRFVLKRLQDIREHISSSKAAKLRSTSLPVHCLDYSALFPSEKLIPGGQPSTNQESDKLHLLNSDLACSAHSPNIGELRRSSYAAESSKDDSSEKRQAAKRFKKNSVDLCDDRPLRGGSFKLSSSLKYFSHAKARSSMFSSHELLTPPRPKSTLGFCELQTPKKESRWSKLKSDLVRGRSMPSLHLAFDKQCPSHDVSPKAKNLEVQDKSPSKKMLAHHTHSFPNPIITVTEHSPQASVQFFLNTDANDSQKTDDQSSLNRNFRSTPLSRSQTDSNITYCTDTSSEASGSLYYITKTGNISLLVLLKAVHAVSMRDNICSFNVCAGIVDVTKMLVSLGLLQTFHLTDTSDIFSSPDNGKSKRHRTKFQEFEEMNVYHLFLDTVMRVHRHLGCPHGCHEGQSTTPGELVRSEIKEILMAVFQGSETQFSKYFVDMIETKPLQETIDIFHSIFGFCCESVNALSPMGCKLTKGPNNEFKTGYSNNFGAGFGKLSTKSIEGIILNSVFKPLVTKVVEIRKDMKTQENMSLYCDIRRFASYVRDNHGGIFRKTALSGLLESAELLYKRYRHPARVVKPVEPETEVKSIFPVPLFTIGDNDGDKGLSHRKSFFRKKTSNLGIRKVPSNQSIYDDFHASEWPNFANLPGIPGPNNAAMLRINRAASPRLSITDEDNLVVQHKQGKVAGARTGAFLSWFKGDKGAKLSDNLHPDLGTYPENGASSPLPFDGYPATDRLSRRASFQTRTPKLSHKSSSHVSLTFFKARKRMEDQFSKFVFGKGRNKQGSFDDNVDLSRRNSYDFDQSYKEGDIISFKESKLVPLPCIKDGMLRFSFLLESCAPGTLPDPPLIAAMLTIKAPLVARAAFFFECACFIHACNRGQWPSWMKLNLPLFRPSVPSQGPSSIRSRNSQALHRIAGRMFYQWAEAIGAYLEQLLVEEGPTLEQNISAIDDNRKRQLRLEDEEEDFLDEANINLAGTKCPYALKMAACQVLLEVTSFLRETHQYLPTRSSKASVRGERNFTGYEPRTVTANRRWSMALSSLGFSQTSAHSLMSLAEPTHQFPHTGERRISFVLHEADGEGNSEHSSNTTITLPGEEHISQDEKKLTKRNSQNASNSVRPHLLRRATGSGHGSGSFKRRSIKLKKAAEKKKHRASTYVDDDDDSGANNLIKRADSLRSRRKVSGISEKSDTSERADVSGDESPGIMSDDGQTPDMPNDNLDADDSEISKNMPWLNVVANLLNSLCYDCSHVYCCVPNCYKRQIRACSRLIKAVSRVYKEDTSANVQENILKPLDDKEDALKKEKRLKKILTGPSSPLRRKTSMGYNVDKHIDREAHVASHSLHSSTTLLPHLDVEAGVSSGASDPRREFIQAARNKAAAQAEANNLTLSYINHQTKKLFHSPMSTLLKGVLVFPSNLFVKIMTFSWELILEADQHIACSAAVAFIVSAVKAPEFASELLNRELQHQDCVLRIKAINKFWVIWKSRYQCWPRMEEGAFLNFKIPPPTIEFTLPSPKIALPHQPVADPPWMPQMKTKIEEVTINQEQSLQRSFVTATKTRRKQQIELVHKALQDEQDKLREEREIYRISSVPVVMEAAYEPILHRVDEHEEPDDDQTVERPPAHHIQVSQAIFPSSLCTAAITIINLLNDPEVSTNGCAVYEVAYKVVWHCLVEDTSLFLRHFFEKLTRENQKVIFQILRRLIRFMPRLPSQAAYTLYNYLIGFVMFYVRSPIEGSQELIGATLSVLWLVIPSVHGLFLKDLKQVLRKEQCDATLLITANVPSTKKIIVHGPDVGGIPSQFPIHEDTQFSQIMIDSLDYFGIDESQGNEYFLVDSKTNQMHNLSAFVRDFYFFKRSQYPQLSLIKMDPSEAFEKLQKQAFTLQFVELGKVLMSLSIVKSPYLAIQRVLFLHEELMKLPSFPRKALEANFNLYNGLMDKEILGMDTLHKIVWVKLVGRMLEVTSGFFAQSSDIHLFLNVVNGALILHCEDAAMLRLCMATLLNAANQFKNIFAINGYLLIMPTILRIYSNHQTNGLLCRTIQFVCKQFYIMHRKPFILQLFGSAAPILDMDSTSNFGDASRVQPKAFFQLLQSMSQYIVDPLDILELVDAEKPLKAWDFCYQMDPETLTILDAISLCVTVIAYAADSQRGQQMLTILEACLPLFMKQMQTLTMKKETPGGPRAELQMIHSISVCMKTLISNSEALTRNFTGPQRAIDLRSSSIKNASKGACSPPYEIDEDSHSRFMGESYYPTRTKQQHSGDEDAEGVRMDFRRPRDAILNVVAEFLTRSTTRLQDLSKKLPDLHQKGSSCELLDVKCHLRLAEIAHSLLKVAPYDPLTMACRGLVRYMNEVLPNSEWRQEAMRPALIMILRRLDKMFNKIAKKGAIKRLTDWEAAKRLLKGVYSTFVKHPYIVHLPHLKSLISICQNIILGDQSNPGGGDSASVLPSWAAALAHSPPPGFCSVAVRLIAMQVLQMSETQTLETICGGAFASPEKTEIYLMNMIYPMCIRISGGLRNVPKLRPCDITFILSVILNTLMPSVSKSGGKSAEAAAILSNPLLQSSLHQIGFLGLKIMMVCFERQLMNDWYRVARCIREMSNKNLGGITLWNFLDFVVTNRTSLFILLLPLVRYKLLQKICDSDEEYFYQHLIKSKLEGKSMPLCRSKGQLLVYLLTELRSLKEDLVNKKTGTDDKNKAGHGHAHGVGHRLSYAFSAALQTGVTKQVTITSGAPSSTPVASVASDEGNKTKPPIKRPSLLRGFSFRAENRLPLRGLSVKLPSEREPGKKMLNRFVRRTSYPYNIEEGAIEKESESKQEPKGQSFSEPRLFRRSTLHIKKRGSKTSQSCSIESSVNSAEGSNASLSGSPSDSDRPNKHRLQRQKAQSRKTFRFRKSRKGAGFLTNEQEEQKVEIIIGTSASPSEKEDSATAELLEDSSLTLGSGIKDIEDVKENSPLIANESRGKTPSPKASVSDEKLVD